MFLEYVKTRLAANASRVEAVAPALTAPQLSSQLKTILEKEIRHTQPRLILEVCSPHTAAAFTVSEVLKAQKLASWVFSVCRSDGFILPAPQPVAPGLPITFGEFLATLRTNGCDNVVPLTGDIAEVRNFFMLYQITFDLVLLAENEPLAMEEARALVELVNDQGFVFARNANVERQRLLEHLVRSLPGCAAICGNDFSVLYKGRVGPSLDRLRSSLFGGTTTRATYNHLLDVHETVPLASVDLDTMMKETRQSAARIPVMEPVELDYDASIAAIHRARPHTDTAGATIPTTFGRHRWAEVNFLVSRGARVSSQPEWYVLDQEGRLFDHSLSYVAREKLLSWRFLSPIDCDRFMIFQRIDYEPVKGLTFIAYGSHNFFHWHFNHLWLVPYIREQLPRWNLAELNVAFLLDGLSAWQSECLDLLGVAPQNVILLRQHDVVADCAFRFDMAIFPEVPDSGHPAAAAYLHRALVAEVRRRGIRGRGPRIFISRSDAGSRRIANEDEVFERLRPLDFVKIEPSHLPYAEQLACFADADVIIGPHGAGLTGMFAAKPNALLIELFSQEFIHPYYFRLSKSVGGRYNYLISERPSINGLRDFVMDPHAVSDIAMAMIRGDGG